MPQDTKYKPTSFQQNQTTSSKFFLMHTRYFSRTKVKKVYLWGLLLWWWYDDLELTSLKPFHPFFIVLKWTKYYREYEWQINHIFFAALYSSKVSTWGQITILSIQIMIIYMPRGPGLHSALKFAKNKCTQHDQICIQSDFTKNSTFWGVYRAGKSA